MAKLVQIKCGLPPYVVEFAQSQAEKTGLPQAQILRNLFMEGYYKTVGKNNSKKERQTNEQL